MISAYNDMVEKLPLQFRLEDCDKSYFGDFICDTKDDLKSLPTDCAMGSIARVIELPSIYRKSASGTWVLQKSVGEDEEI